MLKTIDFMTRGHFVDKTVDLDKLSETSKLLAFMILTTDNRDDTSWINITNKIPLREQMLKDGADPNTYIEFGTPEMLDTHQTIRWIWDALRPNEVERPELYFKRHAKEIENTGAFVNTEFACGMLSVPKELKEMLDLYEALEETRITIDDLLQAKSSGQFKSGEFIKTYSTHLISKTALKRIFNTKKGQGCKMNKYELKLNFLRNKWVGEIMTIKELDSISEDNSQWDVCYTYKNFLEEQCRAFCNYVFPVDDEEYDEEDEFIYFWDKDAKADICDENRDIVRSIWVNFEVLDKYDKNLSWEYLADVRIRINEFEIV